MMIERFDGLRSSCRVLLAAVVVGGLFATGGCGGAEGAGPNTASGARSESLAHEACEGSTQSLDTNGDGKPDIQRVSRDGREACRIVDLNHDGKPDLYEYFDGSGIVRRREFCYDETGSVNAIETYEGGKLAKREYDIGGQHRIDTWDWFDVSAPVDPKTGRPSHPARRERDTTGDGRVDQWWTWQGDKVTITVDRTGDGKPDPEATIVLGGAPASAGADTAAAADGKAAAATADAGPAQGTPSTSAGDAGEGGRP